MGAEAHDACSNTRGWEYDKALVLLGHCGVVLNRYPGGNFISASRGFLCVVRKAHTIAKGSGVLEIESATRNQP